MQPSYHEGQPCNECTERRHRGHHNQQAIVCVVCVGLLFCSSVILFIALVARPYIIPLLLIFIGVFGLALCCVVVLMIVWTHKQTGIMLAERERAIVNARVISPGQITAYLHNDGSFTHLSAIHESAKIKELPEPAATPEPDIDAETILSLYHDHGLSYRTIASSIGTTYHQVQKVVTSDRRRGEQRLKRKLADRNRIVDADRG